MEANMESLTQAIQAMAHRRVMPISPQLMCPQTKSFGRCVPLTMQPLDDAPI
jgi:hypothetical protein